MSLSCNCKNEVKYVYVMLKENICWVMVDYRLRVGLKLSIFFKILV